MIIFNSRLILRFQPLFFVLPFILVFQGGLFAAPIPASSPALATANTDSATAELGGNMSAFELPPSTTPWGLKAVPNSSSQIRLSWFTSPATLGVTGYRVERCSGSGCTSYSQIGTAAATGYTDSGLSASTSYTYRVRANNAAGDVSAYSNTSGATTLASVDNSAPGAPQSLAASASSSTQIALTWKSSSDNVAVTGYRIERCSGSGCSSFSQIATTTATSYANSGLTASTSYTYRVRAKDAAGNVSAYSNTSRATTHAAADTSAPSAPQSLAAAASSSTQIALTWKSSSDNVAVTGYRVERCSGSGCSSFSQIATTTSTSYANSGLTASTSYTYRVRANDAAGNLSGFSNTSAATTHASADTTAPSAPTTLAAAASSSTQIALTWKSSSDNVAVTGYRVERCSGSGCSSFSQIATTTSTSYTNSGLSASTSYTYRVRANDAAGNLSSYSNSSTATTHASADTSAPSAPQSLAATASSSTQIALTWKSSSDNVAVTGYRIERCSGSGCSSFSQIATTTSTSYTNSGLSASTSYTYRVRANDVAGNLSAYSATASATTSGSTGSNIGVNITPKRGGLTVSQTLSIKATLTNDSTNRGVSWSSTGGGTFSPTTSTSGNSVTFTAPSSAGVVTINATSLADGSKSATATLGVTNLNAVATYLNANSRQGSNQSEEALKTSGPTAVNSTNFGKLFSCTVDAAVYAQPLWVANLSIGGARHNVVYVATQHNTLYAFDADNANCQNVWGGAKNLNPSGHSWATSGDTNCEDLTPDVGIIGTPVIDLASNTIYLVTKSKTTSGTTTFHQLLHALDLATGNEKSSGPVEISASVSGTGTGSSGGVLKFDPLLNSQRPALLLENGHVIIAWASHCDNGPYHGWVMAYHAGTLAQEAVLNLSPNGIDAGVWMSGGGPSADSSGNIYLVTGNGTFDATSSGPHNNDYGDSILKLGSPSGGTFPVVSYFRSYQQQPSPDLADVDQGSGAALLPPSSGNNGFLIQSGKDGNIYVASQANLGGFHTSSNNLIQDLTSRLWGGFYGSPTYWNGHVYFGSSGGALQAFSFDTNNGLLGSSPSSMSSINYGYPGPTVPISSNANSNGILWALENSSYCTNGSGGCGSAVLHAYDASNLAVELWNGKQGNNNAAGKAVKFTVPTVANGKVYVGTRGELDVYGLLP